MEYNWFDHVCALFLVVILPILSVNSARIEDNELSDFLPPKKQLYYSNGLMLYIAALLIITSWNISGRSWSDFGFVRGIFTPICGYFSLAILLIYILDMMLTKKTSDKGINKNMEGIVPLSWGELKHFVFLAIAAGVSEEIIFRGFLINYFNFHLSAFPYATYLAILIPALAFSISHIYQGWLAVFKIIVIAILFGTLFIYSKSLILPIFIHILIDITSGINAVNEYNNHKTES